MLRRRSPALLLLLLLAAPAIADEAAVDYNRDIRNLLSDNCYKCHGPDEQTREAGLRFDLREGALATLDSGDAAVVPGNLELSQLIARITTDDESEKMPPVDSGKKLSASQIEMLKDWVKQGAPWDVHWSFVNPQRPQIPERLNDWGEGPIDAFIQRKALAAGLTPNPAADKETLLRRVTFDLTGLPPTLEEIDQFLADSSPQAYEKVVDRLLKSPRYGEHMARYWLDAARYGDTHGLHLDNERSIWPYRNWVINAFNSNMPFDQFTVEQLAGDLLPNATLDQRIATGFNRCNVSTSEGGAIAEEFRVRYAVDRVETTSTVWLGLTAGCAVCHDHKFDPISQREFYQLFAYFNNTADKAMDGNALLPPPVIDLPTAAEQQQRDDLNQQLAAVRKKISTAVAAIDYAETQPEEPPSPEGRPTPAEDYVWFDDDLPPGAKAQGDEAGDSWKFVTSDQGPVYQGSRSHTRQSVGQSQHFFTDAANKLKIGKGDKLFAYVYLDLLDPPKQVMLQWNDGNWEHRAYWGENLITFGMPDTPGRVHAGPLPELGKWVRLEVDASTVGLKPGAAVNGWAFTQFGGAVHWDVAGLLTRNSQDQQGFDSLAAWAAADAKLAKSDVPANIRALAKLEAEKRDAKQQKQLQDYFLEHVYPASRATFQPLHQELARIEAEKKKLDDSIPSTMVMAETTAAEEAFILVRGEYDKRGEKVKPGVPAILPPTPADADPNRLTLARWLVTKENPLTARVVANRFWQQLFGTGLVKTAEDFGAQGENPTHPELLDWLAVEFRDNGWDVKHLMKQMVLSATYRQSTEVSPEAYQIDPPNRLLARGARFRMDAEMIRDTTLFVSGLLVEQVGGKSVKPYQPSGLWKAVGYTNSNTANFKQDHGEDLYRRGLYTFWKRTAPPPSLVIFDAPSREACTVRRARTNTPLQALALMNDVQYVEAARNFAQRMLKEGGKTPDERITFGVRLATGRTPDAARLAIYNGLLADALASYQADVEEAGKLLAVGESPRDESLDPAEHAAYTILANLVLNLSETVNKE
ncbi:PSD1 and planctomycete cytochrome C domain-containing protein [Lignipirellula cremea]|uniref:Planctomycete cytochrome C n=1 Tax=Lignipirellula cremea TaxID=2528010 RepID=A0A518E1K7_9BACT|nr:PSD1 and planctomycete cytochrome C domain-containing protein [Lignipirellula cremea]QDU97977.1 Planctomycete cytochrome C [Lignipirellula cremea]